MCRDVQWLRNLLFRTSVSSVLIFHSTNKQKCPWRSVHYRHQKSPTFCPVLRNVTTSYGHVLRNVTTSYGHVLRNVTTSYGHVLFPSVRFGVSLSLERTSIKWSAPYHVTRSGKCAWYLIGRNEVRSELWSCEIERSPQCPPFSKTASWPHPSSQRKMIARRSNWKSGRTKTV
jgi:hypothetical protein